MNPLEKYPHLFTNGNFKVRWDHKGIDFVEDVNFRKENWIINTKALKECTLIARPIEDMTDDEEGNLLYSKDATIICLNEHDELDYRDFLYLLSIGVYPFDQSHFEDGTVIYASKTSE